MDVIFTGATLKNASTITVTAGVDGKRYSADVQWDGLLYAFSLVPDTLREIVAPPAPVCGPGQVMTVGDMDWTPFKAVQLWPVPAATGTGDRGVAIQFCVTDALVDHALVNPDGSSVIGPDGLPVMEKRLCYPRGISLNFTNESNAGANDYVISRCPHDFDHPEGGMGPSGPNGQKLGAGTSGQIANIRFGKTAPLVVTNTTLYTALFDCVLDRNVDYYINFRSSGATRGRCSSQFNFIERVD